MTFRLTGIVVLLTLMAVGSMAVAAAPFTMPSPMPPEILAPPGGLPPVVHHSGKATEEAYRAALTAPEILASVPCTCGCIEALGHESNLACYVDSVHPDGSVTYSTHGLYCGVCQAITRDAMAGAAKGMNHQQLHTMIVEKYGGQPTMGEQEK